MKRNKGITLIALVITIIVLLILAGITIAALSGENGILIRATEARDNTIEAQEQEEHTLKEMENYINESLEDEASVELTDIYPTLYTDGTLGFSNNTEKIEGKEVEIEYENIKGRSFIEFEEQPWYNESRKIENVIFANEIVPSNLVVWFAGCNALKSIEGIENLNTSKVTSMSGMFNLCSSLKRVNISGSNTDIIDLSTLNTENVEDMSHMFAGCKALTNIIFGDDFNTSKVTKMNNMFQGCIALTTLDLSGFNTQRLTDMANMFVQCESLTSLTFGSNFDTSKVEKMKAVFAMCKSLTKLDLTSFDTSSATTRNVMFMGCGSMKEILVGEGWTEPSEVDKVNMFRDCGVTGVTKVTGT